MKSLHDQKIIKAIGLILLEQIRAAGVIVSESILPEYYDRALAEYNTLLSAHKLSVDDSPELKQSVLDDVRYFLESKGFMK